MQLRLERWKSPLSPLLLVTDEDGLLRVLEFADLEPRMTRLSARSLRQLHVAAGAAPPSLTGGAGGLFQGLPEGAG